MSVTWAIVWFLVGSGLMILGAFFLWRLIGDRQENGWALSVAVLPVAIFIIMATWCGQTEIAMGMLGGTVAVNFAMVGILHLCLREPLTKNFLPLIWSCLGLVGVLIAGLHGSLGKFSGLALVIVGLVALSTNKSVTNQKAINCVTTTKKKTYQWWQLVIGLVSLVVVIVGAWLMISSHTIVSALCGMSVGVFSVVLAIFVGLVTCVGLRHKQQWQCQKMWHSWLWSNVALTTVVLGLVVILAGGMQLTQSMVMVTLPWDIGMTVVTAIIFCLPQKVARWCGGLVTGMYVLYLVSLFW